MFANIDEDTCHSTSVTSTTGSGTAHFLPDQNTPSPSYSSYLKLKANKPSSDNLHNMDHQGSTSYYQGGGSKGGDFSNLHTPTSPRSRNLALPIIKPSTTPSSPQSVSKMGQYEQAQPSPITPRAVAPSIVSVSSTAQHQNGYAWQSNGQLDKYQQPRSTNLMSPPTSPSTHNGYRHPSSYQQYSPDRSITRNREQNWAYQQELKIRVVGIPPGCWTFDVYSALSQYGTIIRIDIQPSSAGCSAWVTFQYVSITWC